MTADLYKKKFIIYIYALLNSTGQTILLPCYELLLFIIIIIYVLIFYLVTKYLAGEYIIISFSVL